LQSKDDAAPPQATDAEITLPQFVQRAMEIEPDLASNHLAAGVQYLEVANFERARKEFHEAMRLEPGAAAPHFLLGAMEMYLEDQEAGLAEFRETVRIAPAGLLQPLAVAGVLEEMGRTSEAMDDLRATIAMHPAAIESSNALVELCLAHKDRKAAIAEIRRSLDVCGD
jgi:tetratricopeptide (TPR) repeat protein